MKLLAILAVAQSPNMVGGWNNVISSIFIS
jgi:hypothetical protein